MTLQWLIEITKDIVKDPNEYTKIYTSDTLEEISIFCKTGKIIPEKDLETSKVFKSKMEKYVETISIIKILFEEILKKSESIIYSKEEYNKILKNSLLPLAKFEKIQLSIEKDLHSNIDEELTVESQTTERFYDNFFPTANSNYIKIFCNKFNFQETCIDDYPEDMDEFDQVYLEHSSLKEHNPVFTSEIITCVVCAFNSAIVWNETRTKIYYIPEKVKFNVLKKISRLLSSKAITDKERKLVQILISTKDPEKLLQYCIFDCDVIMFNPYDRNIEELSFGNKSRIAYSSDSDCNQKCIADYTSEYDIDYRGAWYSPNKSTIQDILIGYLWCRYSIWDDNYELFCRAFCSMYNWLHSGKQVHITMIFDHGS